MHLCQAAFGALWTYDGEYMHAVATRGVPLRFGEFLRQGPHQPARVVQRSIIGGAPYEQIADLRLTDGYRTGDPLPRAGADLGGVRTLLGVALRKKDKLLGVFGIYRQEVWPFTDKQIALLQNFADQAVIAMENARLITETREALEQQTATAEVLGVINSSPGDLAPVFDAMLEKAMRLCEASFGIMFAVNGDSANIVAARGVPNEMSDFLAQHPPGIGPDTFFGRAVLGRSVLYTADIRTEAAYRSGQPLALTAADIAGVRALLMAPLVREDGVLGVFAIFRREVRPFSDKQVALLQNFADQAVIAMENARLITETREALEQQTATAEVLQVINSSPGDLAPVFDAMLEKATRLCGAAFGLANNYDGGRFHLAAERGVPAAFAEWRKRHRPAFGPGTGPAGILAGENTLHTVDLMASEGYRNGDPDRRALVDLGGARTHLLVALRKDDALLGTLAIYRQEVRPFSDKQIALLQNFAAQAVIAMENARLITETREALEQQTATAEVLGVINASPGELAPVFEAVLLKAHSLCGATFGALMTYDGEQFRSVAVQGVSGPFREFIRAGLRPSPMSPFGQIVRGAPFAQIRDLAEVVALVPDDPLPRAAVELGGIRSFLVVALRKEEALIGVITAYRQEVQPFSDKQIALLQNFAAQAVIAMENARLLGELRERTEEVAGWNRELEARVAAQLNEIERSGKLRRFLAPQLADLIVAQGDESILESHRREIVVVFCDVRGFTGFAERAEPEEVMAFLRDYHAALGPIVTRFEGTLDHYGGDGIMVFFNDPLPTPEPAKRAIEMAVAMREAAQQVLKTWRRHGHDIGFGVGISQGYATLGQIGFAERMDYTAIGTVTNLAARLCSEAKDGQILISRRVAIAVEDTARLEEIGDVSLKGLSQAVAVFNVVQ